MFFIEQTSKMDVQHNFNCLNSFVYILLLLQNKILFYTCRITVY